MKQKSEKEMTKLLEEKAIHRVMEPEADIFPKDDNYDVKESKEMFKCPNCKNDSEAKKSCALCGKTGMVKSKAIQRKVKNTEFPEPTKNKLWVAITRFLNEPVKKTEADLIKTLKEALSKLEGAKNEKDGTKD